MIEEVELENFISHKSTSIKLLPGVNVFIGHNGAGKSSVIDAITFALYGKHLRGDENKNLVRRGESQAAVSVKFTSGAKSYLAERKIDAKGRLVSAVLKEFSNGGMRQIAAGERKQMEESMADEVRKITGLTFDMMKIATIVQQGELDKIVTEYKPSEMKNLVNEVIGIEKLDKAYQAMKEALEIFKNRLRERNENYDTESLDSLIARLDDDREKKDRYQKDFEELEKRLNDIQLQERELADQIRNLEQMKVEIENSKRLEQSLRTYVEQKKKEMEAKIEDLAKKVLKAEKFLHEVSEKEKTESEFARLTNEEEAYSKSLDDIKTKIERIKATDLKKMEREISKLKVRLSNNLKTIGDLNYKVSELERISKPGEKEELEERKRSLAKKESQIRSELGAIEEKIRDYETLKEQGVCPVCDSDVDPENVAMKLQKKLAEREEMQAQLDIADKELQKVETLIQKLQEYEYAQKSLSEYQKQLQNAEREKEDLENDLREKIEELQKAEEQFKELEALELEKTGFDKNLEQIRSKKNELQKRLAEIENAESFLKENKIASINDLTVLENERKELELKLRAIPLDIESASFKRLKIDDYSVQLAEQIERVIEKTKEYSEKAYIEAKYKHDRVIMPELSMLTQQEGGLKANLAQLSEEIAKLQRASEELELAKKYVGLYEKVRNDVYNRDGILATSLRSWALKQISQKASEYARSFGIGISQVQFKEGKREVNIICYGAMGDIPVDSMSGGEKVAIALALRFAIADLIGKGRVDFIVFDEPTTHLDEERRRSLVSLISEIGAGEGRSPLHQLIVITHDEDIFENFEVGAIYRFENSADGTRVKVGMDQS